MTIIEEAFDKGKKAAEDYSLELFGKQGISSESSDGTASAELSLEEFVKQFTLQDGKERKIFEDIKWPELESLGETSEFDADKSLYGKVMVDIMRKRGLLDAEPDVEAKIDVSAEKMLELMQKATLIEVDPDDGEIYYTVKDVNGNDVRVMISNESVKSVTKKDLVTILPEVRFDLYQNGSVEKSKEVEAIYIVGILNNIFSGIFNNDIATLIQNYDFNELCCKEAKRLKHISFRALFETINTMLPKVADVIVFACRDKLAKAKMKKDTIIFTLLDDVEEKGVTNLKLRIATLREAWKEKIEAEDTAAKRQVKREQLIDAESKLIAKDEFGIEYSILKSTTESIPTEDVIELEMTVSHLLDELVEREELYKFPDSITQKIRRKLRKRAFREYLVEYKLQWFLNYKRNNDATKPKARLKV